MMRNLNKSENNINIGDHLLYRNNVNMLIKERN